MEGGRHRKKDMIIESHDTSESISNDCIVNINRLYWLNDDVLKAKKFWELGKKIRLVYERE